ncbi:MAG: acylphosphatase, partial [Methanothrix sp.]|nr:acylphosphatase [Methanothrix sp.]
MIRLTAYISGRVQRVGYRAKVVSQALEMGLAGIVQNQPDGRVLVIAEGEKKEDLERFASAIRIENAFIHVDDLSAEYTEGTGEYSTFRKVTGPNEVGERLDDGIEILKEIVISLKNLTTTTKDGFENLTTITEDGFENLTTMTEDGFE